MAVEEFDMQTNPITTPIPGTGRGESGLTNFSVMKPVEFDAPLLEIEPDIIMAKHLEDY